MNKRRRLKELYMEMADTRIGTPRRRAILDEIDRLEKEIAEDPQEYYAEVKLRERVM